MAMNRLNDLWVAVTDQGRHLPRSPIKHAMAGAVNDRSTFGMDNDFGMERCACYASADSGHPRIHWPERTIMQQRVISVLLKLLLVYILV